MTHFRSFFCLLLLFTALNFTTSAFALYAEKSIDLDSGTIKYYQIGTGTPILLLHGLFADKEQWLKFVGQLTKTDPQLTQKIQFILVDLPGYGKSQGYPIEAYNLDSGSTKNNTSINQVRIVHDFIDKLRLKKPISIAGNSMGGLIMTLYAIHYPKEVSSIAFIGSPLGIADFTPRLINNGFRRGFNPFIPTTVEQFHQELSLLFINYLKNAPKDEKIKNVILPYIDSHYKTMTAAYNMVSLPYYMYYLRRPVALPQPSLVLWGTKDYVFGSSSYAKDLCAHLGHHKPCTWYSIADAGHVLMLENQEVLTQIGNYYLSFLRANHVY